MANDIRPFGSADGLGFYWVKSFEQFGNGSLVLLAIDEVGQITGTGARRTFDDAAYTREEAVLEHLAAGIKQADTDLERRRRAKPSEPEGEPKPPPMDRATADFFNYD